MVKQTFRIIGSTVVFVITVLACSRQITVRTQPFPSNNENKRISVSSQGNASSRHIENAQLSDHIPDKLNSILWVQSSTEYQMAAAQSYLLARMLLDRGLEDSTWTASVEQTNAYSQLPPAVIVDVDETVLDNSTCQARFEKAGTYYDDDIWSHWVQEMKAPAVAGALEFLQYAQKKEVMVFYVTNRSHALEQATVANLKNLGFPLSDRLDTVLSKNEKESWGSDKTSRRSFIADQYRILLLIGDDANDFVFGTRGINHELRKDTLEKYHEYWGEKWIVLPNPIYGSWESALYDSDFGLTDKQKVDIKFERMDTF